MSRFLVDCNRYLERILYIWSIRHSSQWLRSGNERLVTPFFVTYLSQYVPGHAFFWRGIIRRFHLAWMKFWQQSSPSPTGLSTNCSILFKITILLLNLEFSDWWICSLELSLEWIKNCTNISSATRCNIFSLPFVWMNNLLIREIPLSMHHSTVGYLPFEGAVTATMCHQLI